MHFTIRILDACPELDLRRGDVVTFEPELTSSEQLVVHRPLPANLGALLRLVQSGRADLVTLDATISDFAGAVKGSWPSPEPAVQPIPKVIDLEAALEALQRPEREAPHEPPAYWYLTPDQQHRHLAAVRRARRRIPKLCRHCGGEFLPKLDSEASCPTCRQARHRKCIRCGGQVTAGDARAKRCASCIEKDATG
jgi:hypothetical protein